MKPTRLIVPPPTPAFWQELEAFRLRERRLYALLGTAILLLCAGLLATLCHVSTDRALRAVFFGVCVFCSGAAGHYAYAAQAAHRALRKNREEAGDA